MITSLDITTSIDLTIFAKVFRKQFVNIEKDNSRTIEIASEIIGKI